MDRAKASNTEEQKQLWAGNFLVCGHCHTNTILTCQSLRSSLRMIQNCLHFCQPQNVENKEQGISFNCYLTPSCDKFWSKKKLKSSLFIHILISSSACFSSCMCAGYVPSSQYWHKNGSPSHYMPWINETMNEGMNEQTNKQLNGSSIIKSFFHLIC